MLRKILLCDDEVHILRPAEFKLRRAGYDVRCASDGEEGWQAIQVCVPDLLITDCQMPRMDGLRLVQLVRERNDLATLPIVMLTAKGFELSHAELRERWNVEKIVSKPFSPRELLKTVDQILGVVRSEAAPAAAAKSSGDAHHGAAVC
jgi:DNA-binding response OmpR family regulator